MARLIRRASVWVLMAVVLLPAGGAWALNMTYGNVVVRNLSSDGFTSTNSFLSFDGGTNDELYQMFGYLGNASGVVPVTVGGWRSDFSASQAITQTSANTATSVLTLNRRGARTLNLATGDIAIGYQFTLVNNPNPGQRGSFRWNITLTNNSATTQTLSFYSYLDLDLYGTYANDIATGSTSKIVVSDAAYPTAQPFVWYASGGAATHYAIGAYPTVENTLNGMTSAQNLSDPTGTFGPGDFTGAFQYDFTLAPGASITLANPVPEPSLAILLFLAASGLALLASRKAA